MSQHDVETTLIQLLANQSVEQAIVVFDGLSKSDQATLDPKLRKRLQGLKEQSKKFALSDLEKTKILQSAELDRLNDAFSTIVNNSIHGPSAAETAGRQAKTATSSQATSQTVNSANLSATMRNTLQNLQTVQSQQQNQQVTQQQTQQQGQQVSQNQQRSQQQSQQQTQQQTKQTTQSQQQTQQQTQQPKDQAKNQKPPKDPKFKDKGPVRDKQADQKKKDMKKKGPKPAKAAKGKKPEPPLDVLPSSATQAEQLLEEERKKAEMTAAPSGIVETLTGIGKRLLAYMQSHKVEPDPKSVPENAILSPNAVTTDTMTAMAKSMAEIKSSSGPERM